MASALHGIGRRGTPSSAWRWAWLPLLLLAGAGTGLRAEDPPAPRRLISLAPNLTEICRALGAGDRVVGACRFCRPPAGADWTSVGDPFQPNLETILTLRPDRVLTLPSQAAIGRKLEALGIASTPVANETLDDLFAAIRTLGQLLDRPAAAAELTRRLTADLDALRARAARLPRRRMLLVVDREPGTLRQIYAAGPGSFLDEVITLLGGENIVSRGVTPYPILSKEEIIHRNPDLIVDCSGLNQPEAPAREILRPWKRLRQVAAVAGDRLYLARDERLLRPGPELPAAVAALLAQIRPAARE